MTETLHCSSATWGHGTGVRTQVSVCL